MSSRSHPSMPRHANTSIASSAKSSRTGKTVAETRDFTSPTPLMKYFDPCAATAGMLLYGQGNSVVVAHHDSLTIERRFSRHSAEVQLLAVDTQSDIGAGRLVVSYDTDMTAIVWDLMTGDEVARFASYENLTCAAWMRNGNVAFGNTQGNIILFEPTTSEHISARTIDQISVTALAPAADCRTFAIGYQNGSLLIATLQPRFTILHNLSTNRAPSPIVNLSWHASSSRQKSDMLAVQTNDGDLRVWSVAKSYSSDDPAKVVRILKRTENYQNAPNWMGWSKNGRIIQFSESETLSWDVRTKHVTYDSIPTLEHVRGLAVYGPGATLFTLGANNTVQQFDLNTPSQMVANVQHPANLLPPSPPVSIEEQSEHGVVIIATNSDSVSAPESSSVPINSEVSESDDDHMSPLARIVRGAEATEVVEQERYMSASPVSSRSHASSTASKSSAGSSTRGRHPPSVLSRGMTENTYISAGSSLRSSAQPPPFGDKDAYSISSISSASMTSSSRPSRHRPSRLRNEVPRSPDDAKVHDLFKFTRSRLHDVPYKRAPLVDQTRLTNEDLRRQMLSIIFGWNKEIQDLVRDELSRHPQGSPSRILLSKWLGDIDADIMTASSENMTSSDWMLLALSGIGGQASQHKLGRAYVQRLLESGDVHAAATIMIGMGDHNDAIEIYVSHKRFMEALILLCLYFPNVWERQAQIIKKWGEFASLNQSIPEVLSPPLSPPGMNRGPQRSIAKTSALKLITSFGDQSAKSKFFAAGDGGQTPIAAGVTPIAESAISPAGYDPTTALLKPSQRSAFNTPSSARVTTPGGFGRQRLPSIGEVRGAEIPTPPVVEETSSRHRRTHHSRKSSSDEQYAAGMSLGRAATASPQMMRDVHSRRKDPPPPSPSPQSFATLMTQGRTSRNGARDRVPDGIDLKLQSIDAAMSDVTSPEQSVASSTRFHWPTRRRGPGSIASSVTSQSSAGRSHHRAPPPVARGINDHISSIEAAQRPSRRHRSRDSSRTRQEDHRARSRESSRSRKESTRDASSERGRGAARTYTPKPAKRSPTSPIPMSPEDLINLSTPRNGEDSIVAMQIDNGEPSTVRKSSQIRRTSPRSQRISSRTSSRDTRRRSPERRPLVLEIRGRSDDRDDGSMTRSPSSPLPMSAGGHFFGSDDEKDYQAAVEQQENFRNRHNRSRGMKEPNSPAVHRARDRSESRKRRVKTPLELEAMENPAPLSSQVYKEPARAGAMKSILTERQAKKEAAARELEERRRSLALRPLAPAIPHPDELSPIVSRPPTAFELNQQNSTPPPQDVPQRSATADFTTRSSQMRSGNRPFIGLPATPKAMRLQFESDSKGKPNVPPIPSQWTKTSPPSSGQPSPDKPTAESPAKEAKEPSPLTLLPSTVYSPPSRPVIERCMSAPIHDQQPPSFQSHSRNGSSARKMSIPEASIRGIDEMLGGGGRHSRRASRDDHIPPPPPPPPILRELQHLVMPPPPPPAPLPGLQPQVYGGGKGTIEIVMDDDDNNNNYTTNAAPAVIPASDADVPIIAPPQTRHARSQSVTENKDNSIAGRFSRATERMRSASRGRTSSQLGQRTKSPEQTSPYESVLPPVSYKGPTPSNSDANQQPQQPSMIERHPREVRATYHTRHNSGTGLSQSEMF
ncbi:WD domain-containing protein [Apiospora marii]|uniref:WD domain-containing protein n=1 Tax=Apiospora marii TaxID=335849 RepID=A0ABR1RAV4_9PEZI